MSAMRDGISSGIQQLVTTSVKGTISFLKHAFVSAKAAGGKFLAAVASHKVIASVAAIALAGGGFSAIQTAMRDSLVCKTSLADVIDSLGMPDDLGADQIAQARGIYVVLHEWGLDNAAIAGIVANFQMESALQSYRVEGIGVGKYEEMENALKDPHTYTNDVLHRGEGYIARDGKKYMGIGLGQWTADRHVMLMDMAKELGKPWHDLELQMAFMVSRDSGASTVERMRDQNGMTPEAAADFFMVQWEKPDLEKNPQTRGDRMEAATTWMTRFNDMNLTSEEESRGRSILDSARAQKRESVTEQAKKVVAKSGCEQKCDNNTKISGKWVNPAIGPISSSFGYRPDVVPHNHTGIDIAPPEGSPIYAANSGLVVHAGHDRVADAGNYVLIDHGGGIVSAYLHQVEGGIEVKEGDRVSSGQLIGHVGSTGNVTGPHLHFEIRENATRETFWSANAIDPMIYMSKNGVTLGQDTEGTGTAVKVSATKDVLCSGSLSDERSQIVEYAKRFLGNPYSQGTQEMVVDEYEWRRDDYKDYTTGANMLTAYGMGRGLDCSGYVQYIFQHFGYNVGRSTKDQADTLATREIKEEKMEPGDIIIWNPTETGSNAHVAIYIGDNKIYHASTTGSVAEVEGKKVYDTVESPDWHTIHPDWPYKIYQVVGSEQTTKTEG